MKQGDIVSWQYSDTKRYQGEVVEVVVVIRRGKQLHKVPIEQVKVEATQEAWQELVEKIEQS